MMPDAEEAALMESLYFTTISNRRSCLGNAYATKKKSTNILVARSTENHPDRKLHLQED